MSLKIPFFKYQGTGNDFILIDNRKGLYTSIPVKNLCDRRFGIGGDGLMLLENFAEVDFKMVYYNSDGNISTMCGNGGRCIVAFAKKLGIISGEATFAAIDGIHHAKILKTRDKDIVNLQMNDVNQIEQLGEDYILNTGSPHFVRFIGTDEDIDTYQVFEEGRKIRQSNRFKDEGINVNFVKETSAGIWVRTYERGVEDETLSCGTGVTACAIATHCKNSNSNKKTVNDTPIITPGGNLNVKFDSNKMNYKNVILSGPAEFVFEGEIMI